MNFGKDINVIARYYNEDEAILKVDNFWTVDADTIAKEEDEFMKSLKENDDFLKLEKLYNYTDELYKTLDGIHVCQKECAFCCKVPVDISELEVEYIENNTSHNSEEIIVINKNDYCPFLDQSCGECTIYEYRPLVCRTFYTFDNPSYCEKLDIPHLVATLEKKPKLSKMYELLLIITRNNPIKKDIRNYFM